MGWMATGGWCIVVEGWGQLIHSRMGECLIESPFCAQRSIEWRCEGEMAPGGGHQRDGRWTLLPMDGCNAN